MSDWDRGQLLGYLIGALEPEEERAIDQRVARDAELRRELARLEGELAPLRGLRTRVKPPAGLAARTCEFVALFGSPARPAPRQVAGASRPRVGRMSPAVAPPSSAPAWRWTEMVVALSVLICIGLALVPAIHRARSYARLTECQNTLRQIGVAYTNLMQQHPARLPNSLSREPLPYLLGSGAGGAALPATAPARNVLLGDGRVLVICAGTRFIPAGLAEPPEAPSSTPLPAVPPSRQVFPVPPGTGGPKTTFQRRTPG